MTTGEAYRMATSLMREHGLLGTWTFRFNNRKRGLGVCYHKRRVIAISRYHVEKDSDAEIRDTILHEIAHAIAGVDVDSPDKHHGPKWKAVCERIGAKPERCAAVGAVVEVPGKWFGVCPGCGHEFNFHRKPKHKFNRWCLKCGKIHGRFNVQKRQENKPKPPSMF